MTLPNLDVLRELDPDEIGFLILQWVRRVSAPLDPNDRSEAAAIRFESLMDMYPDESSSGPRASEAYQLLAEGWQWLEQTGLTVPFTNRPKAGRLLSRRGVAIETREDFEQFNVLRLLPESLVHPAILSRVRDRILRHDFEGAVFVAFRELEIVVRDKGGLPDGMLGTHLMRQAFGDDGPLVDMNALKAERKELENLFASAIGVFKNPGSHRTVPYAADEAVELIVFASRLLKIVDQRASVRETTEAASADRS